MMRRRDLMRSVMQGGLGFGLAGAALSGCAGPALSSASGVPRAGPPRGSSLAVPGLPEPGPMAPVHVPDVVRLRLGGGAPELIVATQDELPLVSVSMRVRCGSAADPPGRAGCAMLLSQMLARGAMRQGQPVDGATLARQAEALGGSIATGVHDSGIWIDMTVMTPRLPEALALLVDLVRRPLLGAQELQQVRAQAIDGLGLRLQDPALLATLVARRSAWGRSLHGLVTTPESLQAVRREDLAAMHRRWFRPDRLAIVLAGDIDPARARALMRPLLEGWRAGEPATYEMPSAAPQPVLPATLLIDLPWAAQSSVVVSAPFVALDAPDRRVAQMAAAVVGGGYSARLNQAVRVRRGLSYGADGRIEQQRAGGLFFAETRVEHRHAAEAVLLMREQMLSPGREPPDEAELQARRAALVGSFARRLDTTEGLATQLGELWAQGVALDEPARFAGELAGVDGLQVLEFVRRRWPAAALRTVVVGRLEGAGESLQGLDAQSLRLDATTLALDSPMLRR